MIDLLWFLGSGRTVEIVMPSARESKFFEMVHCLDAFGVSTEVRLQYRWGGKRWLATVVPAHSQQTKMRQLAFV